MDSSISIHRTYSLSLCPTIEYSKSLKIRGGFVKDRLIVLKKKVHRSILIKNSSISLSSVLQSSERSIRISRSFFSSFLSFPVIVSLLSHDISLSLSLSFVRSFIFYFHFFRMTTKTTINLSPIKRCHGSAYLKKRRLMISINHRKPQLIHSSPISLPDLLRDIHLEQQRRETIIHTANLLRKVGDQIDEQLQVRFLLFLYSNAQYLQFRSTILHQSIIEQAHYSLAYRLYFVCSCNLLFIGMRFSSRPVDGACTKAFFSLFFLFIFQYTSNRTQNLMIISHLIDREFLIRSTSKSTLHSIWLVTFVSDTRTDWFVLKCVKKEMIIGSGQVVIIITFSNVVYPL